MIDNVQEMSHAELIERGKKIIGMASNQIGKIYLVRLHPQDRIKIGFTGGRSEGEERFRKIRAFIPELKTIREWPARVSWETTARRFMLNGLGLSQATRTEQGVEVFDGATDEIIEAIVERGDIFFGGLGDPQHGDFDFSNRERKRQ